MAKFNYANRELTVMRDEYQYGSCKQLALLCFDDTDPECSVTSGCPYGVLTVNLDSPKCEPLDDDDRYRMQFLDVNNWPDVERELADVDWAQPTYVLYEESGFVRYPIWIFDIEKIPHV